MQQINELEGLFNWTWCSVFNYLRKGSSALPFPCCSLLWPSAPWVPALLTSQNPQVCLIPLTHADHQALFGFCFSMLWTEIPDSELWQLQDWLALFFVPQASLQWTACCPMCQAMIISHTWFWFCVCIVLGLFVLCVCVCVYFVLFLVCLFLRCVF